MKTKPFPFRKSLPIMVLFSLACLILYIVSQQVYRLSADDPQYQLATDYAQAINQGTNPGILINPAYTIEMGKSLSPFIIIMDKNGKLLNSNATLNHIPQSFPKGLIDQTLKSGILARTWEPATGIREATVLTLAGQKKDIVVMAGRSLLKVEERIELLGEQILLGWGISLIIYGICLWILEPASNQPGN